MEAYLIKDPPSKCEPATESGGIGDVAERKEHTRLRDIRLPERRWRWRLRNHFVWGSGSSLGLSQFPGRYCTSNDQCIIYQVTGNLIKTELSSFAARISIYSLD